VFKIIEFVPNSGRSKSRLLLGRQL